MFGRIFKSPSAPKLINPACLKPAFKRPDPPRDIDLTSPALKRRKSVTFSSRYRAIDFPVVSRVEIAVGQVHVCIVCLFAQK